MARFAVCSAAVLAVACGNGSHDTDATSGRTVGDVVVELRRHHGCPALVTNVAVSVRQPRMPGECSGGSVLLTTKTAPCADGRLTFEAHPSSDLRAANAEVVNVDALTDGGGVYAHDDATFTESGWSFHVADGPRPRAPDVDARASQRIRGDVSTGRHGDDLPRGRYALQRGRGLRSGQPPGTYDITATGGHAPITVCRPDEGQRLRTIDVQPETITDSSVVIRLSP